jgi:hypothetical protein
MYMSNAIYVPKLRMLDIFVAREAVATYQWSYDE